jgi:hypothetical protein
MLAQCEANGMRAATWDLVRELALAEAKLGEHESAGRRIDALIECRTGAFPPHRVIDYETRVRIAIEAGDRTTAERYMRLLAGSTQAGRSIQPRQLELSDAARRAGVKVELPETGCEPDGAIRGHGR